MYVTEAKAPPGTYFIGDPCYAVPDDDWHDLLESTGYLGLYASEENKKLDIYNRKDDMNGVFRYKGRYILASSTSYGDGCYPGSDGFSYGVDAGMIGAVPMDWALSSDENTKDEPGWFERVGTVVNFKGSIWIEYDDGTITICSTIPSENISIKTGDEEEEACEQCGEIYSDCYPGYCEYDE